MNWERILLPKIVDQYNYNKVVVDLVDQINYYFQQSTSTVKWYKKVAFNLFLGVSITNTYLINKIFKNYKGTITEFRKCNISETLNHYNIGIDKTEKN